MKNPLNGGAVNLYDCNLPLAILNQRLSTKIYLAEGIIQEPWKMKQEPWKMKQMSWKVRYVP